MKPQIKPERNPKEALNETLNETLNESLKKLSRNPHERLKYQNVANTMQMRGWSAKRWQIACKMQGEHGQMCKCHAQCKVTMPKCSKYHAKCKVTMPTCSKYHAKGQILVPHCCKYKANGTRKESQNKFQSLSKKKIQKLFWTLS